MLDEFLFADDMAKGAPTEEKMQKRCGSSICIGFSFVFKKFPEFSALPKKFGRKGFITVVKVMKI